MKHTLHKCDSESCFICEGGLASCTVCYGGEASLPTDCPGVVMTAEQSEGVTNGTMDYRKFKWWRAGEPRSSSHLGDIQRRVDQWLHACMGHAVASNLDERYLRVAEEFAELMSACHAPRDTIINIIREVYDKEQRTAIVDSGKVDDECADLLICIAALATAHNIDLQDETHRILDRNWENSDKIRMKHRAKKHKSTAVIQDNDDE